MRRGAGRADGEGRSAERLVVPALAVAAGAIVFVVVAAVGQAIGLGEWLALGRPFGWRFPLKIGWLYFLSFHRVGMTVALSSFLRFLGPGRGLVTYRVHVALLLGTVLVLIALFRAGRRAARAAREPIPPLATGALVCLGYALPTFLGTLPTALRLPSVGLSIRPVAYEALLLPAVLAAGAATAGALTVGWDEGRGRRMRVWLIAGWRMFTVAIVLAFGGAVLLAGLRPDGTAAYLRAVAGDGMSRAALVLSHHALLLPNQSVLLLVPAMGGCDVSRLDQSTKDLLCFGRQPVVGYLAEAGIGHAPAGGYDLPAADYLFVLVPTAAVVEGGRFARSQWHGRRVWAAGAGAGLVFGALLAAASLSTTVSLAVTTGQASLGFAALSVGPELPAAAAIACTWGVAGGVVGALLPRTQRGEPPRPTSV